MANVGGLLNLCGSEGDKGNVISSQFNLILDVGRADEFDPWHKLDFSDTLFSQKVANLNHISSESNIDGEMGIDESHLVEESASDTDNHVINVRADSSDAGKLLARSEPKVDLNTFHGGAFPFFFSSFLSFNNSAVHVNVLKVALESTARSSHLDNTGVALNLNCRTRKNGQEQCQKGRLIHLVCEKS